MGAIGMGAIGMGTGLSWAGETQIPGRETVSKIRMENF